MPNAYLALRITSQKRRAMRLNLYPEVVKLIFWDTGLRFLQEAIFSLRKKVHRIYS